MCDVVLVATARFASIHDVQLWAASAAFALCRTSEECSDKLLRGGALGALAAALRLFEGRPQIMQQCLGAMAIIGQRDGAIEQLNALGCGTLLSLLLCKYVSNPDIVREGLALLITIVEQWGDLVELVMNIDNARELATGTQADTSDPYCTVYWNGQCIGSTATQYNDLHPIWTDEQFTMMVPPAITDCMLRAVVRFGNVDDPEIGGELKGQITVPGEQLAQWLERAETNCQPMRDSDGLEWSTEVELALDRLEGTMEEHTPKGRVGLAVRFELHKATSAVVTRAQLSVKVGWMLLEMNKSIDRTVMGLTKKLLGYLESSRNFRNLEHP